MREALRRPRCGGAGGYWLPERQRRECRSCRAQVGLRMATVLEQSPLPLATWFLRDPEVVGDPSVTPSKLQAKLSMARGATGPAIAEILSAMASADADRLLAGLPRFCQRMLPEAGGGICHFCKTDA